MTTPDDSTLNGDEAFEEAWKVMAVLRWSMVHHSDTHFLLSRSVWRKAVSRMEEARDRLAEHHNRFSP